MAKVKIQGNVSGTGVFTITPPATSTDRTITLPDSAGTILDSTSTLDATKLSGALPAISGASLTGITHTPADNSVTLAKMAHGTDGELITYDAAGAPANVAVGTSGHVLTSGGAGVAPTFQAAAGGGVDTTGTPADNQIAVFTDSDTVEGDADLKWTGTDFWVGKGSGGGWANDGVELHNYGGLFLTRTPSHTSYGILVIRRNTNAGRYMEFYKDNTIVGTIDGTTSSIAYNTSSDYRLKENVVPMTGAIDRLKALKPSRFNFIADADTTVDGFLAHEAQEVVPEAITGTKDELDDNGDAVMQGIDQAKLVPLLVSALQEAIARIEVLENT